MEYIAFQSPFGMVGRGAKWLKRVRFRPNSITGKQMSDIEIAQNAKLRRIAHLAKDRLGIDDEHLESYGHYKAKISLDFIDSLKSRPDGKLILVDGGAVRLRRGKGRRLPLSDWAMRSTTSRRRRSFVCVSRLSLLCLE